jgi:hypothetical protein
MPNNAEFMRSAILTGKVEVTWHKTTFFPFKIFVCYLISEYYTESFNLGTSYEKKVIILKDLIQYENLS